MCNGLHPDSTPIPKMGYGWKIVIKKKNGEIISLVNRRPYSNRERGIITWQVGNGGFCFFLKKKEAIKASRAYDWLRGVDAEQIVVKIHYFGGMGKHIETRFISNYGFEIALCKKFRFVK